MQNRKKVKLMIQKKSIDQQHKQQQTNNKIRNTIGIFLNELAVFQLEVQHLVKCIAKSTSSDQNKVIQ